MSEHKCKTCFTVEIELKIKGINKYLPAHVCSGCGMISIDPVRLKQEVIACEDNNLSIPPDFWPPE